MAGELQRMDEFDLTAPLAIRQLLEHGHPFDQRTLLSGVELLPAGSVTEVTPGGWLGKTYFLFDPPAVNPDCGTEDIGRTMESAVSSVLQQAGRVAGILGLRHLVFSLDPARVAEALSESVLVTGGTTGVAHLVGHATNREVAAEVDVIFSGMCGDVIMGNVPAEVLSRPMKAVRGLPSHQAGLLMLENFRNASQEDYESSIEADASN